MDAESPEPTRFAGPAGVAGRRPPERASDRDAAPTETGVTAAAAPSLDDPSLYINRELGLLAFQRRVLHEATDEATPLLERVKFLTIVASNLAEFFMVRVGGLKQQVEAGVVELSPDGLTPSEQLAAIRPLALELMQQSRAALRVLLPQLAAAGVHLMDYAQLDEGQRQATEEHFAEHIFPVLTPLAFDPGRPFPHISNLSLNLAILLEDESGEEHFARIKVPKTIPRLVEVVPPARREGGHDRYFVWLEQLIAANLDDLFPGMRALEAHAFRVLRNAEMVIQEAEADDLLETIELGLRKRRFASVVRLVIDTAMPERVRRLLVQNLQVGPDDVYVLQPPLGFSTLTCLYDLDRPDLRDPPFVPAVPAIFADDTPDADLFSVIRRQEVLLHHPFESFQPVVDFLRRASRDPKVLTIKMTLYRVGRDAPVVAALLDAARNGKEVAVLVELKARFDEESNIEWARALEAEGVHVVYGLLGLKTHSKIALVVREEGGELRRYLHLSTGNYNVVTAQLYTDIGFFTTDPAFGRDATDLFNALTGYSRKSMYEQFLVAPVNMRDRLESLIRREIQHQRESGDGRLIFKLNSLIDQRMIRLLYEASQAGVEIDLLVRGMCSLRPGVPGVSDRIRVTSVVGRFLEHSRIFFFGNGGDEQVYLGSADLMSRNLDRRVEVLFPIRSDRLVRHLRDDILAVYLRDNVKAWRMQADGDYRLLHPQPGEPPVDSQALLIASRGGTPDLP